MNENLKEMLDYSYFLYTESTGASFLFYERC
jgi:hypothetical protein